MTVLKIKIFLLATFTLILCTLSDVYGQTASALLDTTYYFRNNLMINGPPSKSNGIGNYFKGITSDLMNDAVHSITDLPGTYITMFSIPFQKQNRIRTTTTLSTLGVGFLFDEEADGFFEKKWEPHCEKYVPEQKFPLPIYVLFLDLQYFYTTGFIALAEYSYGIGLVLRKDSIRQLGYNLMKATAYSFFFAQTVKAVTGRARPHREDNGYEEHSPWEWGHSNTNFFNSDSSAEYNSFPSFHATFYYSYWTVLMGHFGYQWAGPIFASIFYFQIDEHNHWLSDMVAGGILGYWLGSSILHKSKKPKQTQKRYSVLLNPRPGGGLIRIVIKI